MRKFILTAIATTTLLTISAPAFAWCYPNGYCASLCYTVWNGYAWVYQCY